MFKTIRIAIGGLVVASMILGLIGVIGLMLVMAIPAFYEVSRSIGTVDLINLLEFFGIVILYLLISLALSICVLEFSAWWRARKNKQCN